MTVEKSLLKHAKIAELHFPDFYYKIIINDTISVLNHSFIKCINLLREIEPELFTEEVEDLDIVVNTESRLLIYSVTAVIGMKSQTNITEEHLLIIFERAILSGERDNLLQKIFEFNRQPGKQAWYFEKNRIPYLQIGETTYSLYLRETVKKKNLTL